VTFADRVEKQNLYQSASFAAELEMPLEDVQRLRNSLEAPMENGKPMVTVSVVHEFLGGVTLPWLIARIQEWEGMLAAQRRAIKQQRHSPTGLVAPDHRIH